MGGNETSVLLRKGSFMKTRFNSNDKGNLTIYILFAVAIITFAAFLLSPLLLHVYIPTFVAIVALIGIVFLGGILMQMRSGPPW